MGNHLLLFLFLKVIVLKNKVKSLLEEFPIISAVRERFFEKAVNSPSQVIFVLGGDISTIGEKIKIAKQKGKFIFVHIDLTEGIGKDKSGIRFLSELGVDGIISTKSNLIRFAKDLSLVTVQRFFAYDSHGIDGIEDVLGMTKPDFVEIMPGVIDKITKRFAGLEIPLISGGLIETKQEITNALKAGAFAVSTGKEELWYI